MQKKIVVLVSLALMLTACLPAQNSVDLESRVNTAVAQTLEARQQIEDSVAQTIAAQNSLFTPTLNVTATFERVRIVTDTPLPPPTFPTFTPFPTDTPGPPVEQQAYSCFVDTRSPEYLEEIKAGGNFEIRWFVVNTGTRAWDSGLDLKYASGPKMTNPERVEISKALKPGETYKISLNGKAPNLRGIQQMTWVVQGQMCYANVAITVK